MDGNLIKSYQQTFLDEMILYLEENERIIKEYQDEIDELTYKLDAKIKRNIHIHQLIEKLQEEHESSQQRSSCY